MNQNPVHCHDDHDEDQDHDDYEHLERHQYGDHYGDHDADDGDEDEDGEHDDDGDHGVDEHLERHQDCELAWKWCPDSLLYAVNLSLLSRCLIFMICWSVQYAGIKDNDNHNH